MHKESPHPIAAHKPSRQGAIRSYRLINPECRSFSNGEVSVVGRGVFSYMAPGVVMDSLSGMNPRILNE